MSRESIFKELDEEREYQDSLWGTEFDDKNTLNDWIAYVGMYLGQATWKDTPKDIQRIKFLKACTILVAALETFDRNNGFAPRHYEK